MGDKKIDFSKLDLVDAVRDFFNDILKNYFCLDSGNVPWIVHLGVPIYIKDSLSDEYVLVDEQDKDFVYLQQLGKYEDTIHWRELADWADRFYVNMEHVGQLFKFGIEDSTSARELNIKKEAYLKMIGVQTDNKMAISSFGDNSKLFSILKLVISRYYGHTFDINDRDTWANQKDVIEWLKSEHHLSKREAEAIDIVLRPDQARKR